MCGAELAVVLTSCISNGGGRTRPRDPVLSVLAMLTFSHCIGNSIEIEVYTLASKEGDAPRGSSSQRLYSKSLSER